MAQPFEARINLMSSMVKREQPQEPDEQPHLVLPENQLGMEETLPGFVETPVDTGSVDEIGQGNGAADNEDVDDAACDGVPVENEQHTGVPSSSFEETLQDVPPSHDQQIFDDTPLPSPQEEHQDVSAVGPGGFDVCSPESTAPTEPHEETQPAQPEEKDKPIETSLQLHRGGVKRSGVEAGLDDAFYGTSSLPPPVLSQSAIYNRLWRVFQKKKDGSLHLDQRWHDMWSEIRGGRRQIESMFEKVGYNVDRVLAKHWFEL